MRNRNSWDAYAEMMALIPEGNRQLVAAIGCGMRSFVRALRRRLPARRRAG